MSKNYIIYTHDRKTLQWGAKNLREFPSDSVVEIHDNFEDCRDNYFRFKRYVKAALDHVRLAAHAGAPIETQNALRALIPPIQRPLLETARDYRRAQQMLYPVPEYTVGPKRVSGRQAVICAQTGGAWPTQTAAAEATGVTRTAMNAHLKQKKGYDTLRGLQFAVIPNFTGEYSEGTHAEKIREWVTHRKNPNLKKRLSQVPSAIAAVHQKEAARNEVKRTAERWVPPEDGKE